MLNKGHLPIKIVINVLPAIIAVAITSAVVFILSGQIDRISKMIQEQKTISRKTELRVGAINNLRKDLSIVGDSDQKIKNALPPIDNILNFTSVLESLSGKNIKETTNFDSPIPSSIFLDSSSLYLVNYSLTLNGDNINTLIDYLKNFEELPYFTNAASISLSAPTSAGWDGDSTLVISAKIYAR